MDDNSVLNKINDPGDLKKLSKDELLLLCADIREELIKTVACNGGHLASNLGVVELTVAMHLVFNSPDDSFVWDVGHQSYTHKLLTGRRDRFHTLRTEGGISGFPKPSESEHDAFVSGHSSTSISAAYGISKAKELKKDSGYVLAVIGDGALTGGLVYEALNNAGRSKKSRLIVILNDNKMSINRNVGALPRHLAVIRTRPIYFMTKKTVDKTLRHTPLIGKPIWRFLYKVKTFMKNAIYNSTLFEDMGFTYMGPIDGHDIGKLTAVLKQAKTVNRPVLVHVNTVKGKGYEFAEKNPRNFHGISGFDVETGDFDSSGNNFSSEFGQALCDFAERDESIIAISAAMESGTGLSEFASRYRSRFFDVGIAEEHAVTFASGLAAGGLKPVFAVYSTFLQRGYDQLIHDAALQKLKVVIAIDRAGVVGEDGETHQGVFDSAFLGTIPNVTVYAPAYYSELRSFLHAALYTDPSVVCVRYPRGIEPERFDDFNESDGNYDIYGDESADTIIVTYGRIFANAARVCRESGNLCVLKLNRIRPIDPKAVDIVSSYKSIFFFEEGMRTGGIGEHFLSLLNEAGYDGKFSLTAIPDEFVPAASTGSSLKKYGLDAESMKRVISGAGV